LSKTNGKNQIESLLKISGPNLIQLKNHDQIETKKKN